jgi:hypothetical protein
MLSAMAASIGACGTWTTPSEARARVTLWPAVEQRLFDLIPHGLER